MFNDNYTETEKEQRVSRAENLAPQTDAPLSSGSYGSIGHLRIIGLDESVIPGGDGFEMNLMTAVQGGRVQMHSRKEKEDQICDRGSRKIEWKDKGESGCFVLEKGDLFSLPPDLSRTFESIGLNPGRLYSVINKDAPSSPSWHA